MERSTIFSMGTSTISSNVQELCQSLPAQVGMMYPTVQNALRCNEKSQTREVTGSIICEYLWVSMNIYEYLWISMSIYEYLWTSMSIYEYLWISMNIYEYLWVSMNIYEYLWIYLWISLNSSCSIAMFDSCNLSRVAILPCNILTVITLIKLDYPPNSCN